MHSMLKKSLLAMAVASASLANVQAQEITGSASAVDSDADAIIVSSEGLAIDPTITVGPSGEITVNYVTNATVNVNDLLVLTFTGADIDDGSTPELAVTVTDPMAPAPGNVEIIDTDTNTLIFRVTDESIAAATFALSGVTLENVTGNVSVSAVTQIPGTGIEFNEADAEVVAVVASQFAFGTPGPSLADNNRSFDAIIDVEQMRSAFTAGSATGGSIPGTSNRQADGPTVDNFFIRFSDMNADLKVADVETATVELTGEDLGFLLDEDGDLDGSRYDLTSVTGAAEATGSTLVGNTLTASTSADPGSYAGIGFLLGTGANAFPVEAQDFSGSLTVQYDLGGTNGTVSSGSLSAGAWGLSGATVNIPFLPYGPNFAQVIRVSNDGNVAGEIEVTAFDDEGMSFGPVLLTVSAAAGAITNIVPALNAALEEAGFDGSGDLDLTFVINSPAADIEVEANYRVLTADDRVSVTVINP